MKTVELFCGTKSFSKVAAKRGHETFTLDLFPIFKPDVAADLIRWGGSEPRAQRPDILWASPPCTGFSVASIGRHWTGGRRAYIPKSPTAQLGKDLVLRTLGVIEHLKPKWWFIENPRGVLRKMPFMDGLRRVTVWYCRYGDKRAKPTDIWTNVPPEIWTPRPECHNGNTDHEAAPRGAKTGTQGIDGARDRGRIPAALFTEIFKAIEKT